MSNNTRKIDQDAYGVDIDQLIANSWSKIAPFWPLQNLIAVNPLQGLEDLNVEDAIMQGARYFQQPELPEVLRDINCETIKWLQVYFDQGQATITMPLRKQGLYLAWRKLAIFDERLHKNNKDKKHWLTDLPCDPKELIQSFFLAHPGTQDQQQHLLTLLLTSLPGWASYVKYHAEWMQNNSVNSHSYIKTEYLAIRLAITYVLSDQPYQLPDSKPTDASLSYMSIMEKNEAEYQTTLLNSLKNNSNNSSTSAKAQFIFCIDVRSEPFRRALENQGDYETFGYAGFFGVPVCIADSTSKDSYSSCPVLLSPKHTVEEILVGSSQLLIKSARGYKVIKLLKQLYQDLKYTFATPFLLAEILGFFSGIWMMLKNINPNFSIRLKNKLQQKIRPLLPLEPCIDDIPFEQQCNYVESMLRIIGLTKNIAPIVMLCGHGSTTQNNAYATALDCGACGGRHGASNARILAKILNDAEVRAELLERGILIPQETLFLAAEHNTTTDKVEIYMSEQCCDIKTNAIDEIKKALAAAGLTNNQERLRNMSAPESKYKAQLNVASRSDDWAQVRPEWGLAGNAAFIVAPRAITAHINLEGRSFLHSYGYTTDINGDSLTRILTAPMVVAQWINAQYLFSTLDNIAYGAGSKITQNITGKIGVMQGNASDLMTGLPLQSVASSDKMNFHKPQRLLVAIYAPRALISKIVDSQVILQKLFGNQWVKLICIEPENNQHYAMLKNFTWQEIS